MLRKSLLYNIIIYFVLIGLIYFCFNLHFSKNNLYLLYDSKRFYVGTVILLSCVFILVSKNIRNGIAHAVMDVPVWVKILIIMFALSMFISTLNSNKLAYSIHYYLYYAGLSILCCLLYDAVVQQKTQIYSLFCLLAILLFLSVGMAFWLTIYFGLDVNKYTMLSFSNPRFLNQVQIWLIVPLLYLAVLNEIRKRNNYFISLGLLLSVATIIATDGRGISIALISSVFLWALIDKSWRRKILILSIKIIIGGYLVKLMFLSPLPAYIFSDGIWDLGSIRTDSPGRVQLWKDSLSFISLLGNGGGFFICTSESNEIPRFGHPHNSILQILIDWGVIAAISYCLLLAGLLFNVIVTKRRVVRVAGISLLAGFAYSFVSGVLNMPLSQLLAVLSISIYWCCCRVKPNSKLQERKYVSTFSIILMITSALIIYSLVERGIVRAEMYKTGVLQNEGAHFQNMRIDFWLGYNCK
ncbi:O-antigen ligase family protein [Photobacterium satsumensis]|uniref:O-antigen ligase family protein n=1 Tax=Photobacterium satsumensis TaxID=2910239 RepID=UPI003D0FE3ED